MSRWDGARTILTVRETVTPFEQRETKRANSMMGGWFI